MRRHSLYKQRMLDAILPLTVRDLRRAEILARSLQLNFHGLGALWIVTPPSDRAAIESQLSRLGFPGRPHVVAETELVPELGWGPLIRGWYRQQLVKLAIAERVATVNYLTLDADVVCVRKVTPDDLTPSGRGLCHVLAERSHRDWYLGSADVLGLPPPGAGRLHNVTPAVLHREAVMELQQHLASRAARGEYRTGLRALRQRAVVAAARVGGSSPADQWRAYLIGGTPWTEYALYYTWLESSGRLDRYHTRSSQCLYSIDGSVWRARRQPFADWKPAPLFEGQGPPYFAVVQSVARCPVDEVWAKLEPYLGARGV